MNPKATRRIRTWLALMGIAAFSIPSAAENPSPWTAEWESFAAADAKALPPVNGLLLIGSSSIRLWHTAAVDFAPWPVVNRGFGGAHMSDVVQVVDRFVVPYKPQCIVLYAGDNDLAAGKTPERVRDDFVAFVSRVRRHGIAAPIVFVSIKPSPARARFAQEQVRANSLIQDFITKAAPQEAVRYVDVRSRMLDERGEPTRDLFVADALHMNAAGYRLWKETLSPIVGIPTSDP